MFPLCKGILNKNCKLWISEQNNGRWFVFYIQVYVITFIKYCLILSGLTGVVVFEPWSPVWEGDTKWWQNKVYWIWQIFYSIKYKKEWLAIVACLHRTINKNKTTTRAPHSHSPCEEDTVAEKNTHVSTHDGTFCSADSNCYKVNYYLCKHLGMSNSPTSSSSSCLLHAKGLNVANFFYNVTEGPLCQFSVILPSSSWKIWIIQKLYDVHIFNLISSLGAAFHHGKPKGLF